MIKNQLIQITTGLSFNDLNAVSLDLLFNSEKACSKCMAMLKEKDSTKSDSDISSGSEDSMEVGAESNLNDSFEDQELELSRINDSLNHLGETPIKSSSKITPEYTAKKITKVNSRFKRKLEELTGQEIQEEVIKIKLINFDMHGFTSSSYFVLNLFIYYYYIFLDFSFN